MVVIDYDRKFKKHFKARIALNNKLLKRYRERVDLFMKDRRDPVLNDHKLFGKPPGTRAFSITGDVRVVYKRVTKNYFIFLDIGTHPQIYGM